MRVEISKEITGENGNGAAYGPRAVQLERQANIIELQIKDLKSTTEYKNSLADRRIYENEFKKHLVYAMGSLEETKVWLCFSRDCSYINNEQFINLERKLDASGAKIYKLYENWRTL